ncbi:MAG: outer membrane assembly lipoprotein YfiO [Proteobacteria bacterium]|nr:outer membrane assembly lipoprotein YfiO [Pseudomonadota bacterium]
MSCVPDLAALASGFNCDVLGTLVPGNDTRDNLIFLIADHKKQKLTAWPVTDDPATQIYVAYGEGTICVSDASGAAGFKAAVAADAALPDSEKKLLQEARGAIACEAYPDTSKPYEPAPPVAVQSPAGKEFAAYLTAVDRFYRDSHFDGSSFSTLGNAAQPWVREASRYMAARVALLAAQATAFDDYGTLERSGISKAQVTAAYDGLNAYLKDYPTGTYAASARGLLRRADWLAGEPAVLAATYSKAALAAEVDPAGVALANEIDHKLPEEAYTDAAADPLLLAVQDLRLMRPQTDARGKPAPGMAVEVLEAQRSRFAGQEALFDYLLAARAWFVDRDAEAVLKLTGDAAPAGEQDYLGFSRQMLRAAALDAKGEAGVRELYVSLLPLATRLYQRPTLELALAKHDERHKNISAVFEDGSPITDPDVRARLLDHVAGPIILRMQAMSAKAPDEERHTALYRLLVRDLTQGRFKGFLDDIQLVPKDPVPYGDGSGDRFEAFRWAGGSDDGYDCPGLTEIVKRLVAKANDVKGRLCLGDFFRVNGVDPIEPVKSDELGGTGTLFAGKILARHDFYQDIMKSAAASRQDKAYALFRAIHCYQSVGNNACGGEAVDSSQRRKWFRELKGKYGDTSWAKQVDIYW